MTHDIQGWSRTIKTVQDILPGGFDILVTRSLRYSSRTASVCGRTMSINVTYIPRPPFTVVKVKNEFRNYFSFFLNSTRLIMIINLFLIN